MFRKTATEEELTTAYNKLCEKFGEVSRVEDLPVREYMLKWLSVFAPEMIYSDAKAFCLPRRLFKNYLWHAFSFQRTDSYMEEDAEERFSQGFEGKCFVLLNEENLLCAVPDGRIFNPENIKDFPSITIFTEDFSKTYIYTGKEDTGPYYKEKAEDEQ